MENVNIKNLKHPETKSVITTLVKCYENLIAYNRVLASVIEKASKSYSSEDRTALETTINNANKTLSSANIAAIETKSVVS